MLKGKNAVVTGSTSGIGLGIARALAKDGANVADQRLRRRRRDREGARRHREGVRRQGALFAGRHDQARRDRRDDQDRGDARSARVDILVNNAGIQHVAPIEEFPIEKWDADHRHQPVVGVPHHPRRGARHEGAQVGPHHQHRVGAFAGRLAVQGGLRHGQARPRRPDQDGGARARDLRHHLQLHLAGLCLDAAGREADPRHR